MALLRVTGGLAIVTESFGRLQKDAARETPDAVLILDKPQMLSEFGAPGRIRTADHCVRSAVLYPAELRARARKLN